MSEYYGKVLVWYVDIGRLPEHKANAYVKRLQSDLSKTFDVPIVWVPVRNQPAHLEVLELGAKKCLVWYVDIGQLPVHKADEFMKNYENKWLPDFCHECVWVPCRNQLTHLEVLDLG